MSIYTKPDTYTDDNGRRRIDRDGSHQGLPDNSTAPDPKVAELQAKIDALERLVGRCRVVGPGHSGQGPDQMKFSPDESQEGGTNNGTLLKDVVYLDTSTNTLYYTDIYTDGRKDAV